MTINAWKNGATVINEDSMNALLASQPFALIYTGSQRDAKAGSGVSENNIANASFCARFTLAGATNIGRVVLHLDRDGTGADLVVQIRSGMDPGNGDDGTLLKQVVVPKEFIPDPAAEWSVPTNLTGLISGGTYWLVVVQAGDVANHVDWIGEAAQDANYPAYYRNGSSGNWTANNALHFKVYSNNPAAGQDDMIHALVPEAAYTFVYDADGVLTASYQYIPTTEGVGEGVRHVQTLQMSGEYIMGGD